MNLQNFCFIASLMTSALAQIHIGTLIVKEMVQVQSVKQMMTLSEMRLSKPKEVFTLMYMKPRFC